MTAANTSDSDAPSGRPRSRQRWQFRILRGIPRVRIPYTELEKALRQVVRGERRTGDVSVIVADDRTMRRLNRRFRGKDRPTDVLAFPLTTDRERARMEGEIYINHDHARRWRQANGGTIAAELGRLAVHGCLHLLGHRHLTATARRRMAAIEDRCLTSAGLISTRTEGGGRRA
ncbi:MAG TPA: rRNA maturation RNase YbeY [Acidobacteriota bacterium]|nr:rRNA maturation RNase YbeY [Acidobacteriota bacterium]